MYVILGCRVSLLLRAYVVYVYSLDIRQKHAIFASIVYYMFACVLFCWRYIPNGLPSTGHPKLCTAVCAHNSRCIIGVFVCVCV